MAAVGPVRAGSRRGKAALARGHRVATVIPCAQAKGMEMTTPTTPAAIKAYVAAKWRGPGNVDEREAAAAALPAGLRTRIDDLGLEHARLLRVPDHKVLPALERLEALLEL